MFMIAMLCSETIVKVFRGQYTCYTLKYTHIVYLHLHNDLTYQLGDKAHYGSHQLLNSRPTIM